jgi:hypothetical protein
MNKIRFMSIIGALMIASVGMVTGCSGLKSTERPVPASSDDGEAVVNDDYYGIGSSNSHHYYRNGADD